MAKHVAASADNAAVKALVPLIAADTDDRIDVVIPDGNPHWTEVVDFVQPPTCRLMFVHAGSAGDTGPDGGPGKTHIVDDRTADSTPIFILTPNSTGGLVRRFGFTYTQTNNTRGLGSANISGHYNDWNTPQRFREDHCTYTAKATAIGVGGRVIGVVDHCVFNLDPGLAMFLNSWGDSAGDVAWAEPTALGSEHFSFLEDNVINVGTSAATGKGTAGIQDSYRGTRFAVRFNDVDRAATQTHPTGGSNRARGSRAFEIYGNKFRNRGPNPNLTEYNVFFGSSGTGMVHYNDAEGYDNFITGRVNRRDGVPYLQAPTPDGWGYAGTTKTGVGSNWDGNQNPGTGYPCIDQLGRGQGDLLVGDFGEGMINQATGKNWRDPGAYPRQALEPIYIFGNIYVGNLWTDGGQGDVIQANRDYFLDTGGRLGKGLVLPTAAGLPWDGFVKLDGGSWLKKTPAHGVTTIPNFMLFVRDSAGVWKPYYHPFEYPHPFIALTKYDDGPIVIPPDPIPVPPDPVPVPPDPTPIPPEPTPVPPNGPPTVRFVKPSGTGPAYEVITDGKVIAVKWQYIKIEADDDVGPVTLEIWIDNSLLDRNSNGEKTLQVKWNTNPHKGRDPVITGKVMDAADQTAECKATVKVRH